MEIIEAVFSRRGNEQFGFCLAWRLSGVLLRGHGNVHTRGVIEGVIKID